jgi:CMP-N,N'-diacetyllegionaminic acid synthase
MTRVLAVILARGGSKRVPRKNVKPMLGVPLIGYTCRAAKACKLIDRLIVSSDDDEIMETGRQYGADVPFRRPPDISEDVASELAVVHALDFAENEEGKKYDIVVTLQPTSPFVRPEDIDACVKKLIDTKAASCITAHATAHPPEWLFDVSEDGEATPFMSGRVQGDRGVIQALPIRYLPDGAAYATRAHLLRERSELMPSPMHMVIVDDERAVEIDTPLDWIIVEAVGKHYGFKPAGEE